MGYFVTFFLVAIICNADANATEEAKSLIFSSCGISKWSCVNETDGLSETITTVSYQCENSKSDLLYRYNDYASIYYLLLLSNICI